MGGVQQAEELAHRSRGACFAGQPSARTRWRCALTVPRAAQILRGTGPGTPSEAAKAEVLRAQKARLRYRGAEDTPPAEAPVHTPRRPAPRPPPAAPEEICMDSGHTFGPNGCELCRRVREGALNGTLDLSAGPLPKQAFGCPSAATPRGLTRSPEPTTGGYSSPIRWGGQLRGSSELPVTHTGTGTYLEAVPPSPSPVKPPAFKEAADIRGGYVSPLRVPRFDHQSPR